MKNAQLELGLLQQLKSPAAPFARRRASRAAWWFGQMRRMVDGAMDWAPASEPRPEQIRLAGTHREIQLSPR